MPRVSVIIPTYNRADMVGDAIRSVLDQTYADWELILVDDGSSDDTRQIVEAFADLRIRYIYQDNKGLPGARNTGIQAARGQYIAFLDSDDLFLPHKLEWQLDALETRPELGLVAGGHIEVDEQLHVLREVQPWHGHPTLKFQDWLFACPFCPSAPLVPRGELESAGLFDETMQRIEDWDLWLRMAHLGCAMDWIKEPVCYYRIHGGNMVRNVRLMKEGMVTMLEKLFSQPCLPAEIMALRDRAYANVYLNAAARAYAAGAVEEGKAWLTNAVELNPALLKGNPPRVLDSLASFALNPLAGDADAFMDMLMSNLPERDGIPRWSRRKARGLLHAVAAFEHYQRQAYKSVVREAISALSLDPSWLRNRGLISITGRSLVGILHYHD